MAKGQMRSNKEAKKPKKVKEAPAPATTFTTQVSKATLGAPGKGKKG
ncbi:hypothetical protein K32_27180 [Kaistia sp. 32K]|nr:hypothetical protein [Kaistia sp. 32K]BCP54101.1 hypothetical protein K32_27180 [Kaistia sp. 32K]